MSGDERFLQPTKVKIEGEPIGIPHIVTDQVTPPKRISAARVELLRILITNIESALDETEYKTTVNTIKEALVEAKVHVRLAKQLLTY